MHVVAAPYNAIARCDETLSVVSSDVYINENPQSSPRRDSSDSSDTVEQEHPLRSLHHVPADPRTKIDSQSGP